MISISGKKVLMTVVWNKRQLGVCRGPIQDQSLHRLETGRETISLTRKISNPKKSSQDLHRTKIDRRCQIWSQSRVDFKNKKLRISKIGESKICHRVTKTISGNKLEHKEKRGDRSSLMNRLKLSNNPQ